MSDVLPTITIDSREQAALVFKRFPSARASLWLSDYSIHGHETRFGIERKSLADFVGCVPGEGLEYDSIKRLERNQSGAPDKGGNRARFERELFFLRSFAFSRLLIIGATGYKELEDFVASGQCHSRINPASVVNTLRAFEVRYIPVVFAATPVIAAAMVEDWVEFYIRSWEATNHRYELRKKQDERKNNKTETE